MKRWRFGNDQNSRQERREIRAAKAAGLERDYMRGQLWARMVEAETARRRQMKRERRRYWERRAA